LAEGCARGNWSGSNELGGFGRLPEQFHGWLEESVQALRLREVALTWRIAAELQTLAIGHDDPTDRFLVATAKVFDLTLVTADERLIKAPGLKVLANR